MRSERNPALTWHPGWLWPEGLTLQVWCPSVKGPSPWVFAEYVKPDVKDLRYHLLFYAPEQVLLRAHSDVIRPWSCYPS